MFMEEGRKRERRERDGGSVDPEPTSCDSFSIQSAHHRTISNLIKQIERIEEKKRERQMKDEGKNRESDAGGRKNYVWTD